MNLKNVSRHLKVASLNIHFFTRNSQWLLVNDIRIIFSIRNLLVYSYIHNLLEFPK